VPDRPNILLIHSDQHRYDCLGVNGHPQLQTPHLDRLAAEGVNFSHAFTPIPLCVPARNSLLTGAWPVTHGVIANYDSEAYSPAREMPIFSQLLRQRDYWLGYVGKWHVDAQRGPEHYGFCEYVPNARYHQWRAEQGMTAEAVGADKRGKWFGHVDTGASGAQSQLGWHADHVIDMIRGHSDEPFFIRWDPPEPHLPCCPPEPYASLYPPETITPWGSFGDPLEQKPYVQAQQLRTWNVTEWTWDDWAPVVSRYLAVITLMDEQIGRVLAALEESGQADNTLVIYTSDHGDMCGSHGMLDKHFIMYDDVVRVPLIMRWPGQLQAGAICDAIVCNELDMAATFCEVAGVSVPETFVGRNLLDVATGNDPSPREHAFAAYHGNACGLFSQRMARDRRWKYVWNATAQDELYDLETDPWERTNRMGDNTCAYELAHLRESLVAWMKEISDPLLNQWTGPQILKGLSL
jgi:arylsulfatase A-like enzyme